jgi:hypothetical protein
MSTRYFVRAYYLQEARTIEVGPFDFCADAQSQLDRLLTTGLYSSGYVDQEAAEYVQGPQEPASWFGR